MIFRPQMIQSEGYSPLITRFRLQLQATARLLCENWLTSPTKVLNSVSIESNAFGSVEVNPV